MNIIIKDKKYRFGKTRSEQSKNLEREGWGTGFKNPEDRDKSKYVERSGNRFPTSAELSRVK